MKIELHAHTCEVSRCGHVPAVEVVRACKDAGYDGIVITDHYSPPHIENCGFTEHDDIINSYLTGYRKAREEGEKIGLRVFLGIEMTCVKTSLNDYLVYGLEEKDLFAMPILSRLTFDEAAAALPEHTVLYQAHPFRNSMTVMKPEKLFGIEVYNGNIRHDSRNDIARLWAEKYSLHQVSGSDYHQSVDTFCGGADFFDDIKSERELADALRNDRYTLIKSNPDIIA